MKDKIKAAILSITSAIALTAAQFLGVVTISKKILWQVYILNFIPGIFSHSGHIAPGEILDLGFYIILPFIAVIGSLIFGIVLYTYGISLMIKKKLRCLLRTILCVAGGLRVLPVVFFWRSYLATWEMLTCCRKWSA